MSAPPLLVTKANGESVPYDEMQLRRSLQRAGASADVSARIASEVRPLLHKGITTRELYGMAFRLLHRHSHHMAARYRLKRAILDLGPSGFPFERFVARILEHDGYRTEVGVILQGRCVQHEVDVVAERGDQHFLVECKYHNTPGRVCDVKVPLYIRSRFVDIVERRQAEPGNGHTFHQGWLVTNTRFTGDALQYGECAGLRMIGWDQPEKGSLKHRIDRSGLYPLTCLSTLTQVEKERLLARGLVLAADVRKEPEILSAALVRQQRLAAVLREADEVCQLLTPANGTK